MNYPQENPGKQVKKYYDHPTLCYVVYSFSKNIPSITSLVEPFSSNLIIVLVVIFSFSAQFFFWFGNFICICNEEFSRKNVFHHPKHVIVLCRLNFFKTNHYLELLRTVYLLLLFCLLSCLSQKRIYEDL